MPIRKFSFLFFILSLIAGVIGALIGEWLLTSFYGVWPNILLMGVYFGQLAFWAGLFCLLAELMSPKMNGRSWRLEYSGLSWKVLIPSTLLMLFAAGLIFQFFYSLNFSTVKPPDDIVIVMDISDSMNKTDPKRESLKAAEKLLTNMKQSHRASVISFNDKAAITKSMFPISDKKESLDAREQIKDLQYDGGTNIAAALDTVLREIDDNYMPGRKPMVILFSDGYSKLDISKTVRPYHDKEIIINTIGMSKIDKNGAQLLHSIASQTGGSFHDIKKANELTRVFEKIYLENQDRLLMTERYGLFKDSLYLAILRVLFITIIGGLFGLALGMIFDNRYLAKSYCLTGLISGFLAGLVLEFGLQGSTILSGFSSRLIADILLTALTGLGTLAIPVRENFSKRTQPATTGMDLSTTGTTAKRDWFSKGF